MDEQVNSGFDNWLESRLVNFCRMHCLGWALFLSLGCNQTFEGDRFPDRYETYDRLEMIGNIIVEMYEGESPPVDTSLEDLLAKAATSDRVNYNDVHYDDLSVDAWGNKFVLSWSENEEEDVLTVSSLGHDQISRNSDDIVMTVTFSSDNSVHHLVNRK